jgi:hypothetical protein
MIIEIERERPLTTLMFVSNSSREWGGVCHRVIKGLIEKSGSWPDIKAFNFKGLDVYRFNHTNDIVKKEKRIFSALAK